MLFVKSANNTTFLQKFLLKSKDDIELAINEPSLFAASSCFSSTRNTMSDLNRIFKFFIIEYQDSGDHARLPFHCLAESWG
ncbi:1752_t:CDS:1, partial [Funneliformis caledonium]